MSDLTNLSDDGRLFLSHVKQMCGLIGLRPGSGIELKILYDTDCMIRLTLQGNEIARARWDTFWASNIHRPVKVVPKVSTKLKIDPKYGEQDADTLIFLSQFDEPEGASVLEVGANEEASACILTDNGYSVVGTDLRQHLAFLPHRYTRIEGDFVKIAPHLAKGTFDSCFSTSAIEHFGFPIYGEKNLVEDYDEQAMAWMWHLLKWKGTCYVTVPYGRKHVHGEGWRIYNRKTLQERIVQCFKVETQLFFLSGECSCPHQDGFVKEEDADRYEELLPHVTTFLKLRKV